MKYISLSDLREWIFAYMREEITMSRFQELINEKVEPLYKQIASLQNQLTEANDYASDLAKSNIALRTEIVKLRDQLTGAQGKVNGETSDGYHTFNELYDHRALLWINLCLHYDRCYLIKEHYEGWFLLGMETGNGQISYHCPNKYLYLVEDLIPEREIKFDGHTSDNVLDRLGCEC